MSETLIARTRALAEQARIVYQGSPVESTAAALAARLDEPLRVAIAGKVKAGKSTMLNALVGESLAPTDAGECTRIVTWYVNGMTYRARIERRDGTSTPARFSRDGGALEVHLDGHDIDDVARLVVEWPSSALSTMTLIDTPGIGSLTADAEERTRSFLGRDAGPDGDLVGGADAVIYLMRHMHGADARFLEAFHDERVTATPVNAIGVLSRADEIGGGRADSLRAAGRIADRYRHDLNVRRLCQTVVPVAGLLAHLGGTLTELEFRAVAKVAQLPEDECESLLVSADRFTSAPSPLALAPEERAHLIDRFGLFGLRLANALVRAGKVTSSRQLAEELRQRSGLDDLRRELTTHFTLRRDLLKARATLHALTELVHRQPGPGTERLADDIERVEAGAHELAELELLVGMRAGAVVLDEDEAEEVERLVGSIGSAQAARLGLSPDASLRQLQTTALGAHDRWAVRAEHPFSSVAVMHAARVLQRSYQAILAELAATDRAAV
jgi:hypothetical protein